MVNTTVNEAAMLNDSSYECITEVYDEDDEAILADNKYDLPYEAKHFLLLVVDGIHMGITGDRTVLQSYAHKAKQSITGLNAVTGLEAEIFKLYLCAGQALNEVRLLIRFSSMKWLEFCKEHFKQGQSTLDRYMTIASANIAPKYYHIGYSKLKEIVRGQRKVSQGISVNEVLAQMDFSQVKKADCYQTAMNETNKILARKSPELAELGMDANLIDSCIDCDTSSGGFDLGNFIKKMDKTPADKRNENMQRMIASGKQSIASVSAAKPPKPYDINTVAADLIAMLNRNKGKLDSKVIADLTAALDNHRNFNL